jgi:hypothetical protein
MSDTSATNNVQAGTIDPIRTSLMPMSQIISWYYVIQYQNDIHALYLVVMYVSLFYALWALYNTLTQHIHDLGLYTMGIVTAVCYYGSQTKNSYNPPSSLTSSSSKTMILSALTFVWLNFIVVSYWVLYQFNAKKLAEAFKNNTTSTGITWAYVLKSYFISQIILWSFLFYRFYQMA